MSRTEKAFRIVAWNGASALSLYALQIAASGAGSSFDQHEAALTAAVIVQSQLGQTVALQIASRSPLRGPTRTGLIAGCAVGLGAAAATHQVGGLWLVGPMVGTGCGILLGFWVSDRLDRIPIVALQRNALWIAGYLAQRAIDGTGPRAQAVVTSLAMATLVLGLVRTRRDHAYPRPARALLWMTAVGIVTSTIYRQDLTFVRARSAVELAQAVHLAALVYAFANGLVGTVVQQVQIPRMRRRQARGQPAVPTNEMRRLLALAGAGSAIAFGGVVLGYVLHPSAGAAFGLIIMAIPLSLAVTWLAALVHFSSKSWYVYLLATIATGAVFLVEPRRVPVGLLAENLCLGLGLLVLVRAQAIRRQVAQ